MADHVPMHDVGDVVIDDPAEVERINRLGRSADRELARRQKRKSRLPAEPPTISELGGSVPDLTGEMTTEEYLRQAQGG